MCFSEITKLSKNDFHHMICGLSLQELSIHKRGHSCYFRITQLDIINTKETILGAGHVENSKINYVTSEQWVRQEDGSGQWAVAGESREQGA